MDKIEEAKERIRQLESELGPNDPDLIPVLLKCAKTLRQENKILEARAKRIMIKETFGAAAPKYGGIRVLSDSAEKLWGKFGKGFSKGSGGQDGKQRTVLVMAVTLTAAFATFFWILGESARLYKLEVLDGNEFTSKSNLAQNLAEQNAEKRDERTQAEEEKKRAAKEEKELEELKKEGREMREQHEYRQRQMDRMGRLLRVSGY